MAAVNLTFQGMFYDKISRVYYENATMVGIAFLSDLTIGGGPIIPPQQPPSPGVPTHPIMLPGMPGWGDPHPAHPIVIPPDQPPPGVTPPDVHPGDPTTPVPPPGGASGWPVQSMVPPPYIIVNYPGIGPVYVAPPASAS